MEMLLAAAGGIALSLAVAFIAHKAWVLLGWFVGDVEQRHEDDAKRRHEDHGPGKGK